MNACVKLEGFSQGKPFKASLMFVSKAGAYPNEGALLYLRLLAFNKNFKLG
jgi:hypothetical protein